jgi:hypothetical protein
MVTTLISVSFRLINWPFYFLFFIYVLFLFYIGSLEGVSRTSLVDFITFQYFLYPFAFASLLTWYGNKYGFLYTDFLVKIIVASILLVAFIFIFRSLFPFFLQYGFDWVAIYKSRLEPHVDYLFIDPVVIFSIFFTLILALHQTSMRWFFVLIVGSLVLLMAPFMSAMRFPVLFYLLTFMFVIAYRKKVFLALFVFCLFIISTLFFEPVSLFDNIFEKTSVHGFNGKIEDFLKVIYSVNSEGILNSLFGLGLGSSYISDVLGGIRSSYTHNLFSFAFLKGGLIGIVLALIYFLVNLFFLLKFIFHNLKGDAFSLSVTLAFLIVFIFGTMVQPGYRTLSFHIIAALAYYFLLKGSSIRVMYLKL